MLRRLSPERGLAAAVLLAVPVVAGAQGGAQGGGAPPAPAVPSTPAATVWVQSTPAPQAVAMSAIPAPRGWMGIHYICDIETWTKNRELFVKHKGYPLIASVEPGSPADRAGIQAGDTILAYDNEDVNGRVISLTKLLRPGKKISVRVRRARETYEIPVVVARKTIYAPDVVTVLPPSERFDIDTVVRAAKIAAMRADRVRVARAPIQPDQAMSPAPVLAAEPPFPPVAAMSRVYFRTTSALAGAELVRLTEQLGEVFGVSRGVLVLQVAPDTPAARAGLRGGDVITRVNDADVVAPLQLQRALERAGDEQQVKLIVVRKQKEMGVVLRW